MNRTTAYLALAASLLLIAVVLGLPRTAAEPTPPPQPIAVAPTPPAPVPAPIVPAKVPGSLTLSGSLSHPFVTPGTSDVYATLEVKAVEVPGARRAPVNLALVIDRSGSMAGEKIAQARRAASRLVDLLSDEDRLAVVQYGSDVRLLPSMQATAENKARMKRYINTIGDEGGTNIGDGLEAGRRQLEKAMSDFKVNRLLLVSDGQPTVGITSASGLSRVVASIRQRGISVTSLGVGSDFNEDLMQRLSDVGGGSYGFISNAAAMTALFEKDLTQAGTQVARTVSLDLKVPAGVAFNDAFGRPVTRLGDTVRITLPDFAAGQSERLVVHFTATAPGQANTAVDIGAFTLGYTDLLASREASESLALSAMVTTDGALANARRNKDAFVDATRALAAVNYKKAATAMDQGRFQDAKQAIRANDILFDEAAAVGGLAAVDDDRQANEQAYGLTSSAAAAPAPMQREAVKSMKVQSLRSSGRGDSVY